MKADEKLFESKVFTDFVVKLLMYMNAPDSHLRIPFPMTKSRNAVFPPGFSKKLDSGMPPFPTLALRGSVAPPKRPKSSRTRVCTQLGPGALRCLAGSGGRE